MQNSANLQTNQDEPVNPTIHESNTPSLSPKPGENEPAPKRLVAPKRSEGGSGSESINPTTCRAEAKQRRVHKSINPDFASLPRRKVAHLPQKTRDSINTMIRDGVPLREISSHLRHTGA